MPEFSVIIPLYNKGPHVARALNSVQAQTCQDFEVVVIDGGSTDDGPEIVRRFSDHRIRMILQTGKGVSQARNQGVESTSADLIVFLDADDEWTPCHLEVIKRLRQKYPSAGMYTMAFKLNYSGGKSRLAKYKHIPNPPWEGLIPNYFKSVALGAPPAWTSVVSIPRTIFIDVGGFPQGYWFGEDEELWAKIALKYSVAFSWELGAIYHWDASNRATASGGPIGYQEPFIKTMRETMNKDAVSPEFIEPINEIIYRKECYRASKNILAGKRKDALAILKQCKTKWFYGMKVKLLILAWVPYPILHFLQMQKRKLIHSKKS